MLPHVGSEAECVKHSTTAHVGCMSYSLQQVPEFFDTGQPLPRVVRLTEEADGVTHWVAHCNVDTQVGKECRKEQL